MTGPGRLVGERDTADLDVVFGRNADLGVRFDRLVAAPVFGARLHEDRLVVIGTAQRRLVRGRPVTSVVAVAQVDEGAPAIGGGVLAPAGDGEVVPAAVAAAGVGRHDVVASVGQQVNFGDRGVRVGEHAHDRAGVRGGRTGGGAHFGRVRVQRRAGLRHALLQQQFRRPHERIRHEAALHRLVEQYMRKAQQAHALVMRHERRARWRDACPRGTRVGV